MRVGLYVEQPYAWRLGKRPSLPAELEGLVSRPPGWEGSRARMAEQLAKNRAIRAYRSQLPLFGRHPVHRIALYELMRGGEQVAWLPPPVVEARDLSADAIEAAS